ncbi:MAG: hypothetical protein ACXQS7_02170 [Candidatus Syntropharchaeia archaeon]
MDLEEDGLEEDGGMDGDAGDSHGFRDGGGQGCMDHGIQRHTTVILATTGGKMAGRGRMGGRGLGPGGECVCPNCGTRVPHKRGVPCFQESCPKCGIQMVRA